MKWILGAIAAMFAFSACDNELVVTENWKDIPVVWGFLSASDTAHYIRVEKAFLDPATSAETIAQIPDSLYYDNASVFLRRITSGQEFPLMRVDGTEEGYPRSGGTFAQAPNYLYKIKASAINLVVGEAYEFILDRGDGTPRVTAQTIVLPRPVLRNPNVGSLLPFRPRANYTFTWNPIPDAGIYDLQMRFHYRERSPATGNVYEPRQVSWTIVRNLTDREYTWDGGSFYTALKAEIEEDAMATRLFDSVDILIWCAGEELEEFIRITEANTGITGTQDIPTYTNLSEGLGIFTSRNLSDNTGFLLTQQALDTLRNGSVTSVLNFQ